jgi:hypothetical protein
MHLLATLLTLTIVLHPSTQIVDILVGFASPLLTGLLTKLDPSSALKAGTNAVIVVVLGVISALVIAHSPSSVALAHGSDTNAETALWPAELADS